MHLTEKNITLDKQTKYLTQKLVRCYVWNIALYGSETWKLRKLERKYFESFEIWFWRIMGKVKWSDNITNEEDFERIGETRAPINNILH